MNSRLMLVLISGLVTVGASPELTWADGDQALRSNAGIVDVPFLGFPSDRVIVPGEGQNPNPTGPCPLDCGTGTIIIVCRSIIESPTSRGHGPVRARELSLSE